MSRDINCTTCVDWYNPVPYDEDQGENSEPIAFSKRPCQMDMSEWCHFAGERHIIHEVNDNLLTHMEVCTDCYMKLEGVYEEIEVE